MDVRTVEDSKTVRFETRGAGKFGTALEGRVLTQLGGTVWITAPGLGGGEIEVPEGVIEIAEGFFGGNVELGGLTLPATLTVINDRLFQSCSALERVTINGAVTSIGMFAFYECSALGSISLSESLQYIGFRAFARSGLKSITVPSKVEGYGPGPGGDDDNQSFENCLSLEYADIRTPHLAGMMFINCRELKEISLATETKEIPKSAFYNCAKLEKINPDEGRDINLPSGLETIRFSSFGNCSALWGELEIPRGVKAIEVMANSPYAHPFYGCSKITRLILPRSLDLDINVFLAIFDFIESIGLNGTGDLLRLSPEEKLLIKGNVIHWTAKILGDVTIPAGVRDYTKLAGNTSLTSLTFEEDPEPVFIPEYAFSGCGNLVRVTLPSGVQAINNYAFNGCRALKELVITNISSAALTYPVVATVFRNCEALATIKVPQALVETYKANRYWQVKPSGMSSSLSNIITGY
jgi:hypothetical protein